MRSLNWARGRRKKTWLTRSRGNAVAAHTFCVVPRFVVFRLVAGMSSLNPPWLHTFKGHLTAYTCTCVCVCVSVIVSFCEQPVQYMSAPPAGQYPCLLQTSYLSLLLSDHLLSPFTVSHLCLFFYLPHPQPTSFLPSFLTHNCSSSSPFLLPPQPPAHPRAPEAGASLGEVWPTTGHWLWVIKVV